MSTAELRLSLIEKIMRMRDETLEKMNAFVEQETIVDIEEDVAKIPESYYQLLEKELDETPSHKWTEVKKELNKTYG